MGAISTLILKDPGFQLKGKDGAAVVKRGQVVWVSIWLACKWTGCYRKVRECIFSYLPLSRRGWCIWIVIHTLLHEIWPSLLLSWPSLDSVLVGYLSFLHKAGRPQTREKLNGQIIKLKHNVKVEIEQHTAIIHRMCEWLNNGSFIDKKGIYILW